MAMAWPKRQPLIVEIPDNVPSNYQEAKAKYIKLKMEADQHFKDENYERAIEKCTFALEICSIHEFRKEAAELHINLAEIFLKKIPDPQKAFDHAIKGYLHRANAYAQVAQRKQKQDEVDSDVKHAVEDYLKCYRVLCSTDPSSIDCVEPLCQALMLVINLGCPGALNLQENRIPLTTLAQLIKSLIENSSSKSQHLKYLLMKTEKEGSGVLAGSHSGLLNGWSCSAILKMPDLDDETLSRLLDLGASLSLQDIDNAIEILPDNKVELIRIITHYCAKQPLDYDKLYQKSLEFKKKQFAKHFISCGAKPAPVAQLESCGKLLRSSYTDSSDSELTVLVHKPKKNLIEEIPYAQPQAPLNLKTKLSKCLEGLYSHPDDYFSDSFNGQMHTSTLQSQMMTSPCNIVEEPSEDLATTLSFDNASANETQVSFQETTLSSPKSDDDDDIIKPQCHPDDLKTDEKLSFDSQMWEIVCTKRVIDFFRSKKVDPTVQQLVICKIFMLAQGDWHSIRVCKRVGSTQGMELYETRVTGAVRILWQVAIEFSSRWTSKMALHEVEKAGYKQKRHIFSEVIRVWDVVLDHDKLDHCIWQIERSHERGSHASVRIPLHTPSKEPLTKHHENRRIPRMYIKGPKKDEELLRDHATVLEEFIPPASTKEDEYNVVQFWSLSDVMMKSLLEGKNARRDFPYNEWPDEHDIINAPEDTIIVLLGRSGTGKTTCCLYRLWNQFQSYWFMASNSGPLFCHTPLFLPQAKPQQKAVSATLKDSTAQESEAFTLSVSSDPSTRPEEKADSTPDEQHCHLHQIFITKNYVLCAQMKKQFYNLAAGCDFAEAHMQYEDENLSHSLSRIEELAYPLFLTARQFFILLDNSLGTKETFFPREDDGSLKVKILSSDYDHEDPDTLLDLEESATESEDEAFNEESTGHPASFKKEWREITASYFVEEMWPKIAHKSSDKNIDPILVWTEIKSFIKGSRNALESSHGYITESEYEELGKKMAPNFEDNRKEIYKLFKEYCRLKRKCKLFDEGDFIHNIYTRLKKVVTQDLSWSIHYFYIDEVQDFTQAELTVILKCCRQPNGFFLTGDTAQSIMRGISFRFSDLRSLFYYIKEEREKLKGATRVQVPTLRTLTINFRSHSGILQLAASVIELMKEFFPTSFDELPNDEGMFSGRTPPVLLQSCSSSDLAVVLQGNKRESSQIEFGAHQAIIVQNQKAKKELPNELQGGIALTVFEAKGLEFDDILLYNFFKDSKVSAEWRIATSFLKNNNDLVKNEMFQFGSQPPRPLKFDETRHQSLISELKYLYTAITRARCNLWIYDEDESRRLPMFDYWSKRELAKVVQVEDITKEDLFTVKSTPEEWKERGDNFKKKRLWEAAEKCYSKAGSENSHLEMEAKAYSLVLQAHKSKKKEVYLEAAIAFLECDKQHHSLECLRTAAKCIKNAQMYRDAAGLFEKLSKYDQALRALQKLRELPVANYVRIFKKMSQYDRAVKFLLKHNREEEALVFAAGCINDGISILPATVTQLAYSYAKSYTLKKDISNEKLHSILTILPLLPDTFQRTQFLKKVGLYEHACDIYVEHKQYSEAFRLLKAQGKFKRGIQLAKKLNDEKMAAIFVLQAAVAEIVSNKQVTEPDILECLEQFSDHDDQMDPLLKARASLLLGISKSDARLCHRALEIYKDHNNEIGEVEAFDTLSKIQNQQGDNSSGFLRPAIKTLQVLKQTCSLLAEQLQSKPSASSTKLRGIAEDFYSLQKVEEHYLFPPHQDMWIGDLKCAVTVDEPDPDGMLRLDASETLDVVHTHLEGYKSKWCEKIELQAKDLESKLKSFTFHEQIQQGCLTRSFMSYTEKQLEEYVDLCILVLEVNTVTATPFGGKVIENILVKLFSPSVIPYLRLCPPHYIQLRTSSLASQVLQGRISFLLSRSSAHIKIDDLLEAWRILCVLGKGLNQLEQAFHMPHQSRPPPQFVFEQKTGKYQHLFSYWLQACKLTREGSKMGVAIKLSLRYFLQIIARRRSLHTISVANVVNILTIYSTALFAILSHCYTARRKHQVFYIPHTFEHTLEAFDYFNCSSENDKCVLDACAGSVEQMRDLHILEKAAFRYLRDTLDILVGKYNYKYNVLHYAMRSEHLQLIEAKQCLVLVLTLFGNLALLNHVELNAQTLADYRYQIYLALKPLSETQAKTLKQVWSELAITSNPFCLVYTLLCSIEENATLRELKFPKGSARLRISDIPVSCIPKCHLSPIPQEQQIHEGPQPAAQSNTITHTLPALQKVSVYPQVTPSHPATAQPIATLTVHTHSSAEQLDANIGGTGSPCHQTVEQQPIQLSPSQAAESKNVPCLRLPSEPISHEDNSETPQSEYPGSVKDETHTKLHEPEGQPSQMQPPPIARMVSDPSAEEPEEIENEQIDTDDEEINEALAAVNPLPPELEPQTSVDNEEDISELLDYSQVDKNFCSLCAVPLKPDRDMSSDDSDIEAYTPHIKSEKHKMQEELHTKFVDEVKWMYESYKEELSSMLNECKKNASPSLENFIVIAEKQFQENEQKFEQIKRSAEWQVGRSTIRDEMCDRLEYLIEEGKKELENVQTMPQQHPAVETDYVESDHEELIEEANPESLKQEKQKVRQRKSRIRRRQKHGQIT